MGRLRSLSKKIDIPVKKDAKKPITAYRATRLWNQVVNGFKRFMPLKTHRVRFQVYENSFKRDDAQKWLVDFIGQTELLKPITLEKAGVLVDKFIQLNIIEQVCCTKNWLRSPTLLYKFSSTNELRVEKLRSLRYYSRTPIKGTPEVDLKAIPRPTSPVKPPPRSHTPLYVPGKENLMFYANSPRVGPHKSESKPPLGRSNTPKSENLICTPCKQIQYYCSILNTLASYNSEERSLKHDPVFSSTPKDKRAIPCVRNSAPNILDVNAAALYDSPYARALSNIRSSQNIARRLNSKGVKRLGNKGPIKKGLTEKRKNDVIESIIDEFDDLIEAIDKQNTKS